MSPKQVQELLAAHKQISVELNNELDSLKAINQADDRRKVASEAIAENQKVINALEKEYYNGNEDVLDSLNKIKKAQKDLIAEEKKHNDLIEAQLKKRARTVDLVKQLGAQLKIGWKYLQDQDKIIKPLTLL